MTARSRISATLLLALSAVAATGFAYKANQTPAIQSSDSGVKPAAMPAADDRSAAPSTNDQATPATYDQPAPPPAIEQYSVPVPARYAEPPVTVTAPRPSEDELLRNVVMDRLSGDAYLSGRIGVESYRHTVSLTGRVGTTGQVERAGAIARRVDGVRGVNNYLLARVGMS